MHRNSQQIASAVKYEIATVLIFCVLAVVLWLMIGFAEVPVQKLSSPLVEVSYNPNSPEFFDCSEVQNKRVFIHSSVPKGLDHYSLSYEFSTLPYFLVANAWASSLCSIWWYWTSSSAN